MFSTSLAASDPLMSEKVLENEWRLIKQETYWSEK